MRRSVITTVALVALATDSPASARAVVGGAARLNADVFKGLALRSLGPMLTTGRVADFDVDPQRPNVYYVVTAAGGVWKSENKGNDWTSIFDNAGSFNMCCILIDPKDTNVLWVGTGENSNPRSSMIGDGVYKSTDGGKTWANVGLKNSEHIGNMQMDPRNPQRRLRGGAGAALVGRRRARNLQDDRRRQVVEADTHAGHYAGYRRQRNPYRSEQPGRAVRLDLAAASRRWPDDRRRPGKRHLQIDGRRREVGEADQWLAEGRHGPHRDGRGSESQAHARVCVDQRARGHRVLSIR